MNSARPAEYWAVGLVFDRAIVVAGAISTVCAVVLVMVVLEAWRGRWLRMIPISELSSPLHELSAFCSEGVLCRDRLILSWCALLGFRADSGLRLSRSSPPEGARRRFSTARSAANIIAASVAVHCSGSVKGRELLRCLLKAGRGGVSERVASRLVSILGSRNKLVTCGWIRLYWLTVKERERENGWALLCSKESNTLGGTRGERGLEGSSSSKNEARRGGVTGPCFHQGEAIVICQGVRQSLMLPAASVWSLAQSHSLLHAAEGVIRRHLGP
jgi:hypothetical protein